MIKKNKLLDYIKYKTGSLLEALISFFKNQYVFESINYTKLKTFDFIFPLIKRLEFKKAINENDIETVQNLLKNKVQIDYFEYTKSPLFLAINNHS